LRPHTAGKPFTIAWTGVSRTMKKDETKSAAPAGALAQKPAFSLISDERLLQIYSTMVKCRMLGEQVRAQFRHSNPAATHHAAVGLEAAAVSVAIGLERGDSIGSSHSEFITSFIRGAALEKLLSPLVAQGAGAGIGSPSTPSRGRASTPPSAVAAQLRRTIRAARVCKAKKNGKIAVAFSSGDSASSAAWHQALSLAGQERLPVIFVWLDGMAARSSRNRQPADEDIAQKAEACGFPGITVDGNDAVAVYRVACEAIVRARRGGGPTLIECRPYRLQSDAETGKANRQPRDARQRKDHDPILDMERYLARKGLYSAQMKRKLRAGFKRELDESIGGAEKASHAASR
jgi:TPP-dependent pyruvate/acetoin dehydrogenase alpha subunit